MRPFVLLQQLRFRLGDYLRGNSKTTCHPAFMDKFPTFWLSSQIYKFRESRQLVEALALVLSFLCHWWNGYLLLNVADDKPRKEEFNEVSWSFDHPPRVLILVANGSE